MAKKQGNEMIDKVKRMYAMNTVEKKDISIRDLINKEGGGESIVLNVTGIATKFVPKYYDPETGRSGYHILLMLDDGRKTGCFSQALHNFANFFINNMGLDPDSEMNRIEFAEGDHVKIKISVVPLENKKSTYDIEILDGKFDGVTRLTGAPKDQRVFSENTVNLLTGEVAE